MKFQNVDINTFLKKIKEKRLICFGVSKNINTFSEEIDNFEWLDSISCFIDNDAYLHGREVSYFGKKRKVYAPIYLKNAENAIVLITNRMSKSILEIARQLRDMDLSDSIECYSRKMLKLTSGYNDAALNLYPTNKNFGIKKIIHCCWFSKDKKPLEYQKCIDSWKMNCPDYEIKEWNSVNYDIEKNKYMKQAYEQRAWAFVSDYARLDLVYNYGGIYLDMDVQILKNFDSLLKYKGFFSFYEGGFVDLGSGFGAVKGLGLIGELLKIYDDIDFATIENMPDYKKPIPQPTRLLPIFEAWGYKRNMKSQLIDDIAYLSPSYFKVIDDSEHEYRELKGSEYAIHWHHAGWFDEPALKDRQERIQLDKKVHELFANQ